MFHTILLITFITIKWPFIPDSWKYTETIQTANGPVQGAEINSGGVNFLAFKGIPYAEPPLGDLRFKAPVPPKKWTNVRDATKYGSICHQPLLISRVSWSFKALMRYVLNLRNSVEILFRCLLPSEDCLTLNVYTTQLSLKRLRPVLVYIHGGGFFVGDGTDTIYGPEFLVQQDLVIVTLNYRLGVLGFLSTNTTDASGNWGLKDQVLALKWVQDNIANFGGDPNEVTIAGASSGAASVEYHLMSPLSRGLFRRAVGNSGSATCSWTLTRNPDQQSKNVARFSGASQSEIDDPAKRIEFLRKANARVLTNTIDKVAEAEGFHKGIASAIPFTLVVEPPGSKQAFITEDPTKQLAEGRFTRVPFLSGINSLEGSVLYMGFSKLKSPNDLKKVDIDVCKILPEDLRAAVMKMGDCRKVSQQILDVYFEGKPTSTSPLQFTNLFGDLFLSYPTLYSHSIHARYSDKDSPAYFYFFCYVGEWTMFKDMFGIQLPGVVHGDDINYQFKPKVRKLPDLSPTSLGHYTNVRMVQFLSNFVKYGNPTPAITDVIPVPWNSSVGKDLKTMIIGANLTMDKIVLKTRMDLWDSLHKKYLGISIYE